MGNNSKKAVKKMTEAQKKLAEENYNLIGGFCNLYNLEKEDYSDILSLALCESAIRFDSTKGIAFSTYTYQIMNNRMIDEFRKEHSNDIIPSVKLISESDVTQLNTVNDNINSLFDSIPSINNVEEIVLYKSMINDLKNKEKFLSETQKKALDYILIGLSNKEMQLALQCTLRYSEKLRQIIKNKVSNFLETEYE